MDINQVKFGSYSIGNPKTGVKNQTNANAETKAKAENNENVKQFKADDVLNAMNVAGLQNKAQINMVNKKEVNPSNYLSADRIAEIEAMMGKFDDGVQQTANVIGAEIPGLSESMKLSLAARMFAKE